MTEQISQRRSGAVLEVVLDRPKANAIDAATSRALGAVFADFLRDDELRVAIFTGAGSRFFSAGWDLDAAAAGEDFEADYGPGGFGGFTEFADRNKPVICAVNGMAVGGGFEIALAADLVVAADHAEFFLPETGLGLIPDAGTIRLPRLLPRALANEILFAGRRLGAAEAHALGLVNRVAPGDQVLDRAHELAQTIVTAAPLAVAAILDVDRRTRHLPIRDAFVELRSGTIDTYEAMLASADAREGPRAFTERRDPEWKGR